LRLAASDSLKIKYVAYYFRSKNSIGMTQIWGTTPPDADVVVIPSTRSKRLKFLLRKDILPFNKGFASVMDKIAIGTEAMILVPYSKGFVSTNGLVHSGGVNPVVPPLYMLVY